VSFPQRKEEGGSERGVCPISPEIFWREKVRADNAIAILPRSGYLYTLRFKLEKKKEKQIEAGGDFTQPTTKLS